MKKSSHFKSKNGICCLMLLCLSLSPISSASAQQYTSSSSGGESSCEEGRMRRPTHLRPFHHRGDTDSDLPLLRLSSDPDEYSSSEQSCDTVIYVGPNGAAVSDRELTDNEGPPEFVPIIPALLRGKALEQLEQQQQQPPQQQQQQQQVQHQGQPAATQLKVSASYFSRLCACFNDKKKKNEGLIAHVSTAGGVNRWRLRRRVRSAAPLRLRPSLLSRCWVSRWPPSPRREPSV